MAKKKVVETAPTTEKSEVVKGRVGKGYRYCESCDYSTKGARSATCGNCGAEFPKKEKTAKTTGGSSLKEVLEERLAEIEMVLSNRDALELEAERIRALLESIDS